MTRPPDPLSRQALERELGRRYGTVFAPGRASTLDLAFDRAADAVGAPTFAELLARALRGEAAVLDALVRETSVGETYFFREMEGLARILAVARRICRDAPRPITVWSAGCATGEEAYSLAIVFLEALGAGAGLQVLATDVNGAAIERARVASYSSWSFRNVAETRKARWFEPVPLESSARQRGEQWRPIEEVRARVQFQTLNLAADDAPDNRWPTGCDLVVCRNVLVYFAPAETLLAARRFADALAPGGELVTASTDPPLVSTALTLAEHVPPVYIRADVDAARETTQKASRRSRISRPPRARASPVPRAPTGKAPSRRPPPPSLPPPSPAPVSASSAGDLDVSAARALADAGKYSEASALLDPLVSGHPLAVEPRVLRAFVHLSLQHAAEALADADAALLLDPSVPLAHVVAAMASLQLGDRDRAQRSARNALGILGPAADTAEHAELARTCRALLRPARPARTPTRSRRLVSEDEQDWLSLRTLALARPRADAVSVEEDRERSRLSVLRVTSAGGRYAVDLRWLRGVRTLRRLARLPLAPSHVAGLVAHEGVVLPVFYLSAVLGAPLAALPERGQALILGREGDLVAVTVDEVGETRELRAEEIRDVPAGVSERLRGMLLGATDDGLLLLDTAALLAGSAMVVDIPRRGVAARGRGREPA